MVQHEPRDHDSCHTEKHPTYWIPTTGKKCSALTSKAVSCCHDSDGNPHYIGRVFHYDREDHTTDILPCVVVPSKKCAYYTFRNKRHTAYTFELYCVLKEQIGWQSAKDGYLPDGAVEVGITFRGETLYVGRVKKNDSFALGKVQLTNGGCYIAEDKKEKMYSSYEVMVLKYA